MASRLVVVPCGAAKVWDKHPGAGPTPAANAYTGGPFIMNRTYAECFGDTWVILSAKYGFLRPQEEIPGPYNVTFKRPSTNPVAIGVLSEQVRRLGLDRFDEVIGLGGKEYLAALSGAFAGTEVRLVFPFAGLPIGKMLQATKKAIESQRRAGPPSVSRTS